MPSSYRFVVSGRVQGVFFRQSAADRARALCLSGWIANREDGCVEGQACGAPDALAEFREWLHRGPPAARVERVAWEPAEPVEGAAFLVRR